MGKQPEALFDCTKQQWGAPIGIRGAGSRLSFFAANAALQLDVLAYNLGNHADAGDAENGRAVVADPERLFTIGAKIVNRGRYVTLRWPRLRCPGYSWRSCC